jgi:hypothetical protein
MLLSLLCGMLSMSLSVLEEWCVQFLRTVEDCPRLFTVVFV